MTDILGPTRHWLGLVDAFGVLLVLLVWFALRGAGARTRAVAAAAGGLLLVVALATAVVKGVRIGTTLVAVGTRVESSGRVVAQAVLALVGAGVGVAAVVVAHRRAAFATADVDDGTDPVSPAWGSRIDVAAVAFALALPVAGGVLGLHGSVDFLDHLPVTTTVLVSRLLAGAVVGGALVGALPVADETDPRLVLAAFGVVAAGAALLVAALETFANEFWSVFGIGLAAGLLVVAAPPLVVRAFPVDRTALTAGACAALALLVLDGIAGGRVSAEQNRRIENDVPIDIGTVVPPVFPSFPEPTFEIPSFPVPTIP